MGYNHCNIKSREFVVNGEQTSDSKNEFNNYFSTVEDRLSDAFDRNSNYCQYLTDYEESDFTLSPTSLVEIIEIVSQLKNSAPGPDGIPARLFKDNIYSLAEVIYSFM